VNYTDFPAGSNYSAIGRVGGGAAQASIIHDTQLTSNVLSPMQMQGWYEGASGSIRLQRSAGVVTVTTRVDDKSIAAASTGTFSEEPLLLALWFASEAGAVPSTRSSSVRRG